MNFDTTTFLRYCKMQRDSAEKAGFHDSALYIQEIIDDVSAKIPRLGVKRNPSSVTGGKSIATQYFGATNTRGAKIKASVIDGNRVQKSITISYPHELDMEAAHLQAAITLRDKMNWTGDLIGVGTRTGYAFGFKDIIRVRRNPRGSKYVTHRSAFGTVLAKARKRPISQAQMMEGAYMVRDRTPRSRVYKRIHAQVLMRVGKKQIWRTITTDSDTPEGVRFCKQVASDHAKASSMKTRVVRK